MAGRWTRYIPTRVEAGSLSRESAFSRPSAASALSTHTCNALLEPKQALTLLSHLHPQFSGLANNKTVGVAANKDGKIEIALKNAKAAANRRPNKLLSKYQLNKHMRSGNCKAASTINKLTTDSFYRRVSQ